MLHWRPRAQAFLTTPYYEHQLSPLSVRVEQTLLRLLLVIPNSADEMSRVIRNLRLPYTGMMSDPFRHLLVLPAVAKVAGERKGHAFEDRLAKLLVLGLSDFHGVGGCLAGDNFGGFGAWFLGGHVD